MEVAQRVGQPAPANMNVPTSPTASVIKRGLTGTRRGPLRLAGAEQPPSERYSDGEELGSHTLPPKAEPVAGTRKEAAR
jgi:hypothetical protein